VSAAASSYLLPGGIRNLVVVSPNKIACLKPGFGATSSISDRASLAQVPCGRLLFAQFGEQVEQARYLSLSPRIDEITGIPPASDKSPRVYLPAHSDSILEGFYYRMEQ